MTIQVLQDDVDGLALVLCRTTFWTGTAELSGELLDCGLDVEQLGGLIFWPLDLELFRPASSRLLGLNPQGRAQAFEQSNSCVHASCGAGEGVINDTNQKTMEPLESSEDSPMLRRVAEESVDGTETFATALMEIEVGTIEGEAQVLTIGRVVEHPLAEAAHDGQAGAPFRHSVADVELLLPRQQFRAGLADVLAEATT
jgi:hypothetical protein